MSWTVILLPRAKADIRSVGEWFGSRNRRAESRWYAQMLRVVEKLATNPSHYPQAEDNFNADIDLRELIVGRRRGMVHRVLFTIGGQIVYVHRVRHAAQDTLSVEDLAFD